MQKRKNKFKFISYDKNYQIEINNKIILKTLKMCNNPDNTETGGIMLGYYTKNHHCAIITKFTEPQKDSIKSNNLFLRGIYGLQKIINHLWKYKNQEKYLQILGSQGIYA